MTEENENKERKSKNFTKKIKNMFLVTSNKNGQSDQMNNKKKIENIVVLIILLIITVIIINSIWNGDRKNDDEKIETKSEKVLAGGKELNNNSNVKITNESNSLEERLENILQNIEGVGKVKVLLTYSESSKIAPMYNEDISENSTEETDTSGRK